VGPFLSVHKKVSPEEEEFLEFIREYHKEKEFSALDSEGINDFIYARHGSMQREINVLLDQNKAGARFDELQRRMIILQAFAAKWSQMIHAYKERLGKRKKAE